MDEQRTIGRLSETRKQSRLSLSCHSGISCKELREENTLSLSFFVCIWERAKNRILFGGEYTVAAFLTKIIKLTQR